MRNGGGGGGGGGGASCSCGTRVSHTWELRLRRTVVLMIAGAVFLLALAASDTTQAAIGDDDDDGGGGVMSQSQHERERDAHVRQQKAQISLFLNEMDADQNGEVETAEAARYIEMHMGKIDFDGDGDADADDVQSAVKRAFEGIDSIDSGFAIDSIEMHEHLKDLLSADRVAAWIAYGVQLPAYESAFHDNDITGADFPMLINDDGEVLETELGVRSRLHKDKILRALRMQVLGLTLKPGMPVNVTRTATSGGASVSIEWLPPEDLGRPAVHGYLVQKRRQHDSLRWEHAEFVTDEHAFVDDNGGAYDYRVQSWNLNGHSEWAFTEHANIVAPPPTTTTGRQQQVSTGEGENAEESTTGEKGTATAWIGSLLVLFSFGARFLHFNVIVSFARKFLGALLLRIRGGKSPTFRGTAAPGRHLHASSNSSITSISAGTSMRTSDPGPNGSLASSSASSLLLLPGEEAAAATAAVRRRRHSVNDGAFMRSGSMQHARSSPRRMSVMNIQGEHLVEEYAARRGSPERTVSDGFGDDDGVYVDYCPDATLQPPPPPPPDRSDSGGTSASVGDTRNRCAFPGCTRRWDRFRLKDLRNSYRKHYCCSCQLFYCHKHTRVSSHSPRVSCDIGSNCYCEGCFDALDPQHALKLDSNNQLEATLIRSNEYKHGQASILGGGSRTRKKSP